MRAFPLFGEDAKPDSAISKILQQALDIPPLLDAAPTTTGGQLNKHGDIGYFSTNLYIRLGATTYSIALTAV